MQRALIIVVAILIALSVSSPNAAAQKYDTTLLERVRSVDLDTLTTGRTTVHFYPGYDSRADRLGMRVERALAFFNDSLGIDLEEFHLILPNPDIWPELRDAPYGMPGTHYDPPAAFLPADAGGAVFEHYLALENCLSPQHKTRLEALGLSWEEAARKFVETIAFHELGHVLMNVGPYAIGTPTAWLAEFMAAYVMYAYLVHNEPDTYQLAALMSSVNRACYTPRRSRLEEMLFAKRHASDYIWYQSKFENRAQLVVANSAFDFLRDVREAFPPESVSGYVDPLYQDLDNLAEDEAVRHIKTLSNEVLRKLDRIEPGLWEWGNRFGPDNE